MKKIIFAALSLTVILIMFILVGLIYTSSSYTKRDELIHSSKKKSNINNPLPQVIHSVPLNKVFTFAGEEVPYDNFDAMERLDRELTVNSYWHSSTLINIKKSKRYFPIIESILAQEGVPDDFKYLAVAESNLSNVRSPAGARGFWQIMRATALGYKLEVNKNVDERYHLEKSTHAACHLLKDYKKRFGTWTLAAAAYNMGETLMAREIKSQREDNYYNMNFGQETGRYVFRLIAFKEILNNPTNFGFFGSTRADLYLPINNFYHVEVKKSLNNLGDFAHEHGTTYRMLKVYNPWLMTNNLPVKTGKSYMINIPRN